jgi:hypothetical protein
MWCNRNSRSGQFLDRVNESHDLNVSRAADINCRSNNDHGGAHNYGSTYNHQSTYNHRRTDDHGAMQGWFLEPRRNPGLLRRRLGSETANVCRPHYTRLALLVKNPDAHKGETVRVYGYVTQFDAATGTTILRANASGVRQSAWYDFTDNAMFGVATSDEAKLTNVVEGDLFTAEVKVAGSYSYDTQIGGNTTVPLFLIDNIVVTGHKD